MDEIARLRELVELLLARVERLSPSHRWGVIVSTTAGTPLRASVNIGGSTVATPLVPVFAHVTGLAAGSVVSIRVIDGETVIDGKIS